MRKIAVTTRRRRGPFEVINTDSYGPRDRNPIYAWAGWRISRKHWVLPGSSWGWQATKEGKKTVYADTLEEMAEQLGAICALCLKPGTGQGTKEDLCEKCWTEDATNSAGF